MQLRTDQRYKSLIKGLYMDVLFMLFDYSKQVFCHYAGQHGFVTSLGPPPMQRTNR